MSKILGIWGYVPEESSEWHDRHVRAATKGLGVRGFLFDAGENTFPEEHKQDATSFTLYEGVEKSEFTGLQSGNGESLQQVSSLQDMPKDALLESRYYTCEFSDQVEDFSGEYEDAGCLVMGNFQPTPAQHDEFFKWWYGEFVPMIQRSPDFLRVRLWKLESAADIRRGAVTPRQPDELLKYIMAYEFRCDDIPWEILVDIGQSEGWQRLVEHDLQYKYGLYQLKRIYAENGETEAEIGNDSDYSDEEQDNEE